MSIFTMISHTPIWVWIIFIFLIARGINALQPREMPWQRMLILPVIFFVWAIYGIGMALNHLPIAFGTFAVALIVGGLAGWLLGLRLPPARLDPANGLIHRPGTWTTLILVMIGFVSKYTLSIALVHQPNLASNPDYCGLYGAISGLVDGIFWGVTILQLFQAKATASSRTS